MVGVVVRYCCRSVTAAGPRLLGAALPSIVLPSIILQSRLRLMHRNVMSPIIARPLGACIRQTSRTAHARSLTSTSRWQQNASDRSREHEERLSLLQSEDHRLLKPVKDRIDKLQAQLDETREFLKSLPTTLKPILGSSGSYYTLDQHYSAIHDALGSLDRLKKEKLPTLRAHVEDLEFEEYPEPGNTESEIEFLQRVRSMNPAERKDLLESLNLEIGASSSRSRESRERYRKQLEDSSESEKEPQQKQSVERKENPFAKTAAKAPVVGNASKAKAESKGKGWLISNEQSDNVIADAAPAADMGALKKKKAEDKANFGLERQAAEPTTWKPTEPAKPTEAPKPKEGFLHGMQAKLEASWKAGRS